MARRRASFSFNAKSFALLISAAFIFGSELSWAGPACEDFFSNTQEISSVDLTQSELSQLIHNFRESKISRKSQGKLFEVEGVQYIVEGTLGRSSSTAYLARDPQGNLVSLKVIRPNQDDPKWPHTIFYEMAVTQFYLDSGEVVPRILGYETFKNSKGEITMAILVKEYREGLTYDELQWLAEFRNRVWRPYYPIRSDLMPEKKRLFAIHKGFRAWLDKNKIDLWQYPFSQLKRRIDDTFDASHDNFIFDTSLHRWVLFDP